MSQSVRGLGDQLLKWFRPVLQQVIAGIQPGGECQHADIDLCRNEQTEQFARTPASRLVAIKHQHDTIHVLGQQP